MASDISVTINPPAQIGVTIADGVPKHSATHAPEASDSLSAYYVTGSVVRPSETGNFILASQTGQFVGTGQTGFYTGVFYPYSSNPNGYVQGAVVRPSNTGGFLDTGSSQTVNSLKNFLVRPTVSGTGVLLSGEAVTNSQTGQFVGTGQTGSFITSSQTGTFVGTDQTGFYTGVFYPYSSNPNGYVQGSVVRPSNTGAFLDTGSSQTINSLKNFLVRPTVNGTGVLLSGETPNSVNTGVLTGVFYPLNSNPNGYITGVDLSNYVTKSSTGIFVTTGQTGNFITISQTGGFVSTGSTGSFITSSQTGQFVSTGSTGSFVTGSVVRPSETGNFITVSQTGAFYPISNPSGFITGVDLSSYVTTGQTGQFVTGSVVRPSETGIFITTGQTGSFITASQTGAFYPNSNPSGFITGVDLSSYATTSYVTGVSGYLQYQISNFSGSSSTGSYVSLTGDETISGIKNFISRPTVNTTGVLISGDAVDTIHLYGKNDESFTLNKGQPVYIGGANGTNPLIKAAANTGEFSSSKTIGLLAQDLSVNALGYAITEGILEGFDTSAGAAGDPMWLGSTGQILYGTGNKPYGLNNLVYLGVVLRSQSVNGKVYVKIQNGFEIEELHNVYALNPSNKDSLLYNSGSGAWFARQVNTGDVSGISAYALAADTGSFITVSQTGAFAASALTGAFLTTGAADGRYYGLVDGQSISGYAITGFNDAITGMTITGDTTKVITLFQRGGSTVTGSFTDNAGTGGGSSQYVQEIYIDAGAMLTGISGASPSSISVSNSGIAYDCFNFDASTSGYAQFKLKLPDYNLGNLKARFDWTTSGASGAVVWGIQGVAIGDGDSLSTAWGSPQEISDSFITGTGVHVTSSTPEITLAGSPQANDLLFFRVYRDTFDAGDTLAVNASLLGLKLQYTGIQIQPW